MSEPTSPGTPTPLPVDDLGLDPAWVAALRRVVVAEQRYAENAERDVSELLADLAAAALLRSRIGDLMDRLMLDASHQHASVRTLAAAIGVSSPATVDRHLRRIREGRPRRRPSGT